MTTSEGLVPTVVLKRLPLLEYGGLSPRTSRSPPPTRLDPRSPGNTGLRQTILIGLTSPLTYDISLFLISPTSEVTLPNMGRPSVCWSVLPKSVVTIGPRLHNAILQLHVVRRKLLLFTFVAVLTVPRRLFLAPIVCISTLRESSLPAISRSTFLKLFRHARLQLASDMFWELNTIARRLFGPLTTGIPPPSVKDLVTLSRLFPFR